MDTATLYAAQANLPTFLTVKSLVNPLNRDPLLLSASLTDALSVQNAAQSLEDLRDCIGDSAVLERVGDLEARGINDENNTLTPVQIPLFDATSYASFKAGNKSAATANVGTETRNFYLYGNHHSEDRVSRYWKVLLSRIFKGDSLSHAHFIAKKDVENLESVNFPELYYMYQLYPVNDLTGGVYSDVDPRVTEPGDAAFVLQLRKCLSLLAYRFFNEKFPDLSFEGDLDALIGVTEAGAGGRLIDGKLIPFTPKPPSSNLTKIGLALGGVGLLLLMTGKKGSS